MSAEFQHEMPLDSLTSAEAMKLGMSVGLVIRELFSVQQSWPLASRPEVDPTLQEFDPAIAPVSPEHTDDQL